MNNLNRILPVKTAVSQRITPLLAQTQRVRDEKQALTIDPLMRLAEAMPMLGNPSYTTMRGWIRNGTLKVWRAGRGHFRVRLSEVQRFLSANEVKP
jgi:excisionase family DNA binding protein